MGRANLGGERGSVFALPHSEADSLRKVQATCGRILDTRGGGPEQGREAVEDAGCEEATFHQVCPGVLPWERWDCDGEPVVALLQ